MGLLSPQPSVLRSLVPRLCLGTRRSSVLRPPRLLQRELAGEVANDPADAPLVQAGAGGDLGQREALALQPQQLVVLRRTQGQELLPQVVGLDDLAGPGLRGGGRVLAVGLGQRPLALQGAVVL